MLDADPVELQPSEYRLPSGLPYVLEVLQNLLYFSAAAEYSSYDYCFQILLLLVSSSNLTVLQHMNQETFPVVLDGLHQCVHSH